MTVEIKENYVYATLILIGVLVIGLINASITVDKLERKIIEAQAVSDFLYQELDTANSNMQYYLDYYNDNN